MCSGSEAGSYFRLIDFVYHSTLGLSVIKKKKKPFMLRTAPEFGSRVHRVARERERERGGGRERERLRCC